VFKDGHNKCLSQRVIESNLNGVSFIDIVRPNPKDTYVIEHVGNDYYRILTPVIHDR
jgi:hypothetical protein